MVHLKGKKIGSSQAISVQSQHLTKMLLENIIQSKAILQIMRETKRYKIPSPSSHIKLITVKKLEYSPSLLFILAKSHA